MSDKNAQTSDEQAGHLVAHRSCGDCNVCCVALTIDDPEMQKLQGYRCKNTLPNRGCAIYDARPNTCREFHCGWRKLKWVREPLRPDKSGVLVRLHYSVAEPGQPPVLGVVFTFLTNNALKAEGLAESVAAAVAAGIPVHVNIPGPPGYTSGQARIDEVLTLAVMTKDKKGILDILRQARVQGKAGNFKPIVLSDRSGAG